MEARVIAGRYRLERPLGAGGMSEVWAAQDLELERTVAVKLLAPDADPTRFEREARAAAALSHPNIAAVYDYGTDEGTGYMVLEYLPGGTLEDRLAPGTPLPDTDARRIAREIAAGLAHAHERGLVHRDLKPSNILFDAEGRAKIADLGIARLGASTGATEVGTVLGTAAYISPEQAAGRPAAAASDVYAFGVILFRMLTGRLPFESPDALAVVEMHRDRTPPPVSEFRDDAPPALESLATASLAKSPADRPPDGRALLAELSGTATGGDTALTQIIRPARPRRRALLATIAVCALAAAGIALAVGLDSGGNAPTIRPPLSTRATTARTASPTAPPVAPVTPVVPTTATTAATTRSTTAGTTTAPATTAPPATSTPTAPTPPPTTAPPPPTTTASTTTAPVTTATTPATTTTAAVTTTSATTTTAAESIPSG